MHQQDCRAPPDSEQHLDGRAIQKWGLFIGLQVR
jgi:hypothetical protein